MNIETTAGHLDIRIDPSGTLSGEYRAEMTELTPEDAAKDEVGFTNPNLHRRFDIQEPHEDSGELAPREYDIRIADKVHSYRTTTTFTHQEVGSDIP